MGYHTDFFGVFELNKPLDKTTEQKLEVYRNDDNDEIIKSKGKRPHSRCAWCYNSDKQCIEWDGTEKFYFYVPWIVYLIENLLISKKYSLNGSVKFRGADENDFGVIEIKNNNVSVHRYIKGPNCIEEYMNTL